MECYWYAHELQLATLDYRTLELLWAVLTEPVASQHHWPFLLREQIQSLENIQTWL
jgi:hypothetical protein